MKAMDIIDRVDLMEPNQYSPEQKLHWLSTLDGKLFEEAMLSLSDMPQRCPLVSDDRLSQMGYRKLIVKNYVVFFSIDEKNKVVDVERILYGRRDWIRFL